MKYGIRRLALLAFVGGTTACSLLVDLSGFSEPLPAPPSSEAAVDAVSPEAAPIVDGGPQEGAPPCLPTTIIDTPLTTTLGSWDTRSHSLSGGYPKVETFFGTPAAVLLPFVDTTPVPIDAGPDAESFYVPPEHLDAISGLWQTTPVPLRSFDVAFEYDVRCTSDSSCADGLVFAWLDTTSATSLTNDNYGNVSGIPLNISGGAVVADTYRNNNTNESGDPPVPALEIVKIDGEKKLGEYPWVLASKGVDFRSAWHKLTISARGQAVSVAYDDVPTLIANVPSVTVGLVGLTAGTGGKSDAVAVRNVRASFYDCVSP